MSENTIRPPKWADESRLGQLRAKSTELVEKVKTEAGPALMRVIDGIGGESQDKLTRANDSMQQSVGGLLKGLDGKSPTAERLLEMRGVFDELNPNSLSNAWWFSWMPKGIKRKAVKNFAHKYQSMQTHVQEVMNGLRSGKDTLLESSIELEGQYKEIQEAHRQIQSDIYVGENLYAMIESMEAQTPEDDAMERQKLAGAKNKTARRIRDLRTKEQAALQFFVSIDQTVASNELLGEQIDSALSVGPMVMTNALRIQAALAKQQTVKDAVDQFQSGLGELMSQNAAAVNQAAQEIGDLYNNPVIALDKMQESFDSLMNAVNTANETMAASTVKARETSAALADMSAQLAPVAEAMRDDGTLDVSASVPKQIESASEPTGKASP